MSFVWLIYFKVADWPEYFCWTVLSIEILCKYTLSKSNEFLTLNNIQTLELEKNAEMF